MQTIEEKFRVFLKDTDMCSVNECVELFKKTFGKNRRTYFSWKKNIKEGKPMRESNLLYRSVLDRESKCYMCDADFGLVVHHIDRNTKNSGTTNLVILCPKCHSRLHKLIESKNHISVYVVTIEKKEEEVISAAYQYGRLEMEIEKGLSKLEITEYVDKNAFEVVAMIIKADYKSEEYKKAFDNVIKQKKLARIPGEFPD